MRPFNPQSSLPARGLARSSTAACLISALIFFTVSGCSGSMRNAAVTSGDNGFFGWHFHAPFDTSEVKTVAIFFKSNVFRRDLEKGLYEAVVKEINLRTPYRVVSDHEKADSLLTATITSDNKNLVVEAPTNLPRELNATITVQANWTHNPPTDIEAARTLTLISETINFIPEVGETAVSGYNHVIQSIAKQMVDMMEQAWFTKAEDLQ
jgi:hypothetical protein